MPCQKPYRKLRNPTSDTSDSSVIFKPRIYIVVFLLSVRKWVVLHELQDIQFSLSKCITKGDLSDNFGYLVELRLTNTC